MKFYKTCKSLLNKKLIQWCSFIFIQLERKRKEKQFKSIMIIVIKHGRHKRRHGGQVIEYIVMKNKINFKIITIHFFWDCS